MPVSPLLLLRKAAAKRFPSSGVAGAGGGHLPSWGEV